MKTILKIILAVVSCTLCHGAYAASDNEAGSPAGSILETNRNTKKLDGMVLKMAKPIIRNTPMVAIMDDIEMMMLCPVEKITKKDNGAFASKVKNSLKDYTLVEKIDDELSKMYIYVYGMKGDSFREILLYISNPEENIILFRGDFTVEGLKKVGELSKLDREKRIKDKKETGKDDSYLKHIK